MGKIAHIVLFKLKQGTEESAKQAISALKHVPGPISAHVGPPVLDARAKGFNWGLYSVFANREALDTYAVSKAHVDVVTTNVRPNIDDILAYDFEFEDDK